jgi:hypothetical protein
MFPPMCAEARDPSRPDDEIIEDVLRPLPPGAPARQDAAGADLTEEEATRLAVEELHAMRRERDAAA